ncbi:MAG: ABC transporter ATP-binding protein/permease [Pseudomonadota bacterium]|nr:ABC transporter ATP-binding protein/permease [Pseudomonadota bacterium]
MSDETRALSGRKLDAGFEWGALRSLAPYLWSRGGSEAKTRVLVALFFLAGAKIATVYIPIVYGAIVDSLATRNNDVILVPVAMIIAFGALRVLSIAFAELRDAIFTKVAQRAIRDVALQTFRHLHTLSLRYHLERQTGGLSHAIERGTKAIDFLLRFMLFNILPTLLEIAFVCAILWSFFSFWYAFITFISIVVYIAYTMIVTEWRLKWRREMNETDQRANSRAIDSLLNYETVKYFGNEDFEASRYDFALQKYESASVISKTSLSFLNIGQAFIIGVGLTLMVLMAGDDVANGKMSVGDFVMVNTFLMQLYIPLNFLGFVYREIKQSLTDMEAIFFLLTTKPEVNDAFSPQTLRPGPGLIEFLNVSFAYDPRRAVLSDVTFKVEPGQKFAIVGPSGSGKSTVGRLLFRFYDTDKGVISIDGVDIREATQESLRATIGIVPQDCVLFNDTILYNIAYGRPKATRSEIEEAARQAAIHEFIMSTPDKYETLVGERGLKISGGEKQRVAIARTILKRPQILVFDEATSALDTNTEREIQNALNQISQNTTTLIIAHRLSTVIDADKILVLNKGCIEEEGTHVELLAKNGLYAEMWNEQQREKNAVTE